MGDEAGLKFRFDRQNRTPNTELAHRLVWFAGRLGRQTEVVEALYRAYFAEGKDVGKIDVLAALGTKLGLDPAETRAAILSDDAAEAFRPGHQEAVRLSIRGVPLFVVNGKVAFGGAQPVPMLPRLLQIPSH